MIALGETAPITHAFETEIRRSDLIWASRGCNTHIILLAAVDGCQGPAEPQATTESTSRTRYVTVPWPITLITTAVKCVLFTDKRHQKDFRTPKGLPQYSTWRCVCIKILVM